MPPFAVSSVVPDHDISAPQFVVAILVHCASVPARLGIVENAENKRLFSNDLRIAQCLKSFKMKTVALRVVLKASVRPNSTLLRNFGLLYQSSISSVNASKSRFKFRAFKQV